MKRKYDGQAQVLASFAKFVTNVAEAKGRVVLDKHDAAGLCKAIHGVLIELNKLKRGTK